MRTSPLVAVTAVPRSIQTTLPGLSPHSTVHRRFGELVVAGGGVPVMVDASADPEVLVRRVDAIVINGGGDVSPWLYGAERHPQAEWIDVERDQFEISLVRAARREGLPLLGVCRGLQVINVAAGGTLAQHLPELTATEHSDRATFEDPVHPVEIVEGSALHEAVGRTTIEVNSLHHQAIDRIGEGLAISARSHDGTIEGIEADDGRTLGVQWHPELLDLGYEAEQVGLFRALAVMAQPA